eukprot:357022-Chlamydomonas_euryale.AAC.1
MNASAAFTPFCSSRVSPPASLGEKPAPASSAASDMLPGPSVHGPALSSSTREPRGSRPGRRVPLPPGSAHAASSRSAACRAAPVARARCRGGRSASSGRTDCSAAARRSRHSPSGHTSCGCPPPGAQMPPLSVSENSGADAPSPPPRQPPAAAVPSMPRLYRLTAESNVTSDSRVASSSAVRPSSSPATIPGVDAASSVASTTSTTWPGGSGCTSLGAGNTYSTASRDSSGWQRAQWAVAAPAAVAAHGNG